MTTGDHTVPQMHLRRFARRRKKADQITARSVDDYRAPFTANVSKVAKVRGFYWSVDDDGETSHQMEELLTLIEGRAATAFRAVLDDDPDYALTYDWPPKLDHRLAIAWWLSAQIVRTSRQHARVEHLASLKNVPPLAAPDDISLFARNHTHLAFMVKEVEAIAAVLFQRPWGLGFADHCLLTSDVPVVIVNDHDADNQRLAAAVWDIVCPLDPHRLLFLPGIGTADSASTRRDHRTMFDGMLGLAINQLIFDAAERHVFHHPDHPPPVDPNSLHRLPRPWAGEVYAPAQFAMNYGALPDNMTIERRWLTEHPPSRAS